MLLSCKGEEEEEIRDSSGSGSNGRRRRLPSHQHVTRLFFRGGLDDFLPCCLRRV